MTNGPPSTAATSSKTPSTNGSSSTTPQSMPLSAPSYIPAAQVDSFSSSWSRLSSYPLPPGAVFPTHNANTPPILSSQNSYHPNVQPNVAAAHFPHFQHYQYAPLPTPGAPVPIRPSAQTKRSHPQGRSDTPPLPDPQTYKHWDDAVKNFLLQAKLLQTLKGFEHDMVVLNPQWEQEVIPTALKELVAGLQITLDRISGKRKLEETSMDDDISIDILSTNVKSPEEASLDERKLEYVSLASGNKVRSHSSLNKSISEFLAKTRSRNDASNRAEFLYTLSEKRRRFEEAGINLNEVQLSSCARVDAKPIDRDKQIQYDIAINGEGPLIKTVKHDDSTAGSSSTTQGPQPDRKRKLSQSQNTGDITDIRSTKRSKWKQKDTTWESSAMAAGSGDEDAFESRIAPDTQSALSERLTNIEEHLAVRYVPSVPRTFLARLKYLEDHLINLEKEYPPWAALHFNQPSRGWPAPPRATPIIVPPHLRSVPKTASNTAASDTVSNTAAPYASTSSSTVQPTTTPVVKSRKGNSTLHRAVMDRLEVQRAMKEMKDVHEGT